MNTSEHFTTQGELEKLVSDLRGLLASKDLDVVPEIKLLRQRLDDFHNDQLGGAYYLFLRGMPSAGVYFSRPSDGLLDALDNLFAEGK